MKGPKRSPMICWNPSALTASSTEETGRIIIKISFMKEVLWLGVQQSEVSQSGVSFLYRVCQRIWRFLSVKKN